MVSRLSFCVILVFCFQVTFAQAPHKDILPSLSGTELIQQLKTDFTPGKVADYSDARIFMYTQLYNRNDTVTTIYTGYERYLDPSAESPIQFLLSGSSDTHINTEHSFPRSKGADRDTRAGSDLHHLYPARANVNSARANLPFGEVEDQQTVNWYIGRQSQNNIPSNNIDGYSELGAMAFEPRESEKGNIARSMFYFYTIYQNRADNADPSFFSSMVEDLCEWHFLDPVDSMEWNRSRQIGEFQEHEANPYVLDCSLASRTYCEQISDACQVLTDVADLIHQNDLIFYPNPADKYINLGSIEAMNNVSLKLYSMQGQLIKSSVMPHLDLSDVPDGMYFIISLINKKQYQKKIIVRH